MLLRAYIVLFTGFVAGCDLPPLPTFGRIDASDPTPTTDAPETIVCAPASSRCIGNSVRRCSADGTDFHIDACGVGETCSVATCEPIANTCETSQPFALSATELAFDVTTDLKSQTKQVRLQNCSAAPVILRDADVRGPGRPDGTPVFELVAPIVQTSIPAGEAFDIKVTYRPTAGLSHVTGRLELSLVLDELTNVQVGLRSKALCVTSTPFVDAGMRQVAQDVRSIGRLQNCGTEPVTVRGWEGPPFLEMQFDELPFELLPGRELGFEITSHPEAPTFLDANVTIALSDPLLEPTTKLRGLAVWPDCIDVELADVQILANNQERPPEPGDLVRIRFPDADPGTLHWLDPLRQPQSSFERLDRGTDGWTTRPRVIGRYRATLRGFDIATGKPSCQFRDITFDVVPADGLHVELSWIAEQDGIPQDLGFGHSTNLDLHVLSTTDGDGRWNHVETDCFSGVVGPCGAARGTISVSQGGLPEFVRFDSVDGMQFEVGVYLSNPFNFPGVLARVRVYRGPLLVAELESQSLQSANDFWLVGRWADDEWTEINRVFSGFPF